MSFQQLYTYQAETSIEDILRKCRMELSKGTSSSRVLSNLYFKLYIYIRPIKEERDMTELRELLNAIMMKIIDADDKLHVFDPLIQVIANNENELVILKQAIDLGIKFYSTPTVEPIKSKMTFLKSGTEASNFGRTAPLLNEFLKTNLRDNVICAVPNFWAHFFEGKDWTGQASRIWESYTKYETAEMKRRSEELKGKKNKNEVEDQIKLHKAKEEKILLGYMTEKEMWDWFNFFEKYFLNQFKRPVTRSTKYPIIIENKGSQVHGRYYRTNNIKRSGESMGKTQIDFLIKSKDIDNDYVDWRHINVAGEFTISLSRNKRKDKFFQLSSIVREAYCAQPLRRFMHGFCMFKDEFELWVFDCTGAYSSGRKSIIDAKEMFVKAICSYLLMSDEELGRDLSILEEKESTIARFPGSDGGPTQSFEVKHNPVLRPKSLVTRGTTCYEAKDHSAMIKYSWSRSENNYEVEFMKNALSVPGVVKYITSELVYKTSSHLGALQLSDAKVWNLNADDNTISPSPTNQTIKRPSLERDRFLFRIAMTPLGRRVYSGGSILAFVAGIRDAIRAHQGLVDISILHGDISEGNIILKDPTPEDDLHGTLIDFDCSVRSVNGVAQEEEMSLTGTLKFLALERLKHAIKGTSISRTYRHDLESFFYVLIVGCIEYEILPDQETRNLDAWCEGSNDSCYDKKNGQIVDFQRLPQLFTPSFKGLEKLAKNLWTILFGDGKFIATPKDPGPMYSGMIKAFDETIEDLRAGRIENATFIARRN